ncbi:DUF6188 family protein [Arthrobacter sp. 35W]|uniref:DUF6188 family protein n=1 Tax=Arthrobacter sp. 35W TaxID=1132441 RepID=UPI0005558FF8|nr:DUF6188 family protein [Arthrobacter sp. 35W]
MTGEAGALAKTGGDWELPVADEPVTQLRIDYAITLLFANGLTLRIEQPFGLSTRSGEDHVVDPEGGVAQLLPVLGLRRATATKGTAFVDGHLDLWFADGRRLTVPPGDKYEAWQVSGPGKLLIVSVPSGGLSIWGQARAN